MSVSPLSTLLALAAGLSFTACLTSLPLGGSTPSGPAAGTSPGAGGTCCVNDAFYACPDAGALDRCSGALARCLSGCAMSNDMGCPDRCVQDHPPDPSGCARDVARDSVCAS